MALVRKLTGCFNNTSLHVFSVSIYTLSGILWNICYCHGVDTFVSTTNGYIRGIYNTSTNVTEFRAIPYAKKPIGKLRFVPPVSVESWNGIYDATKYAAACLQRTHPYPGSRPDKMSDDCLYLNIYVPGMVTSQTANVTSMSEKPVMVWIHSGGFIFGHINTIDFTFLCRQSNIIIVAIAYRLDIFGFLSFHNDVLPGNAGLLDQNMAINWVKNNIEPFGGDPTKITLYGESSGASSVFYHIASPHTEGLFQRAIIGSGSFIQGKNQHDVILKALTMVQCAEIPVVKKSDFSTLTIQQNICLLNCFQNQTTEILINITQMFHKYTFLPVVDNNYVPHALKYTFNHHTKQKKNIACLAGINKDGFPVKFTKNINSRQLFDKSLKSLNKMLSLEDHIIINDDNLFETKKSNFYKKAAILSKYLPEDDSYRRALLNAYNGKYSTLIQRLLLKLTESEKYFYYFTPRPSFARQDDIMAAALTDELPFVFGNPLTDKKLNATDEEKKLSRDIMKAWGTFVSFGVPKLPNNIKWPTYESENRSYVELSPNITQANVKLRLRESDWIFWNELIPELEKLSDPSKATSGSPIEHTTMHREKMNSEQIAWGMEDKMVKSSISEFTKIVIRSKYGQPSPSEDLSHSDTATTALKNTEDTKFIRKVHDLLMGLLVVSIFLFVICVTLIVILCKLRSLKIKNPPGHAVNLPDSEAPDTYCSTAKLNEAYLRETNSAGGVPLQINPETVTKF